MPKPLCFSTKRSVRDSTILQDDDPSSLPYSIFLKVEDGFDTEKQFLEQLIPTTTRAENKYEYFTIFNEH